MKFRFQRKYFSIPYIIFMALFIIVPMFLIAYYAFSDSTGALSGEAAKKFFTDPAKFHVILVSLFIAIQTTLICLIIGYPIAYILAKKEYNHNVVLIMLFIMPMWINFVLRTAATRDILFAIGITGGDYPYLATLIGMVYNYLPFVILPLYTTMLKMDKSQIEASRDLGASGFTTFIKVVIPMTMPGIISAATMVFMPTLSSYVISDVLSEYNVVLFGSYIDLYFNQADWNFGSFMAFIMLLLVFLSVLITRKTSKERNGDGEQW